MSVTQTIQITINGAAASQTQTVTGTGTLVATLADEAFASDAADTLMNIAIDFSALQSLYICATEGCTVETNSGAAPDDTFTLTADTPIVWYTGCGYTNPITADVTKVYVTQTAATAGTLRIEALQDATP